MSNIKRSWEWRIKQSISHSKRNNYLYGKTYEEMWGKEKADEIKKKKSLVTKGKIISKETRKKCQLLENTL